MTREEAINELNFYRNQHYADSTTQESRILADAINEILPHYAALREQEERSKVVTQADRIRAMTDEELAEDRVHSYISGNLQVWYGDFYGWEYIKRVAVERELKWLKQPYVKEDA